MKKENEPYLAYDSLESFDEGSRKQNNISVTKITGDYSQRTGGQDSEMTDPQFGEIMDDFTAAKGTKAKK